MIIRGTRGLSILSITLTGSFCALLALASLQISVADETKKDDTQSDAPAAPQPQQKKQFDDMLKWMFGPNERGRQQAVPQPRTQTTDPSDSNSADVRDPVENRVPRDPKADQLLQAADLAAKQRDFKLAIDLYQRLLDLSNDSLNQTVDGKWQSLQKSVNRRIAALPEPAIAEYRSQYAGLAKQHLIAAQRSGRPADFAQVADRFFHTPSGYEAAQIVASWHFDRSEFAMAARWYDELADAPIPFVRRDSWLLQAALTFTRADRIGRAGELVKRMSQGDQTTVALGTGSVRAADLLQQTIVEQPTPESPLVNWLQVYGTAARVGTVDGGDALLSANWSVPLTSNTNVLSSLRWLLHDLQDLHRAAILAAQPLAVDGRIVYRDLRGLRCVDIESGRTLWEGVEGVSAERILGGVPAQQIDPQDAWRFPNNVFSYMGDYQGLSAEYSPLANVLYRDGTYGLISSDQQQVFAIEDHGILSSRQFGHHGNLDGNAESLDAFGVPWKTNRLVAYDLTSGRANWIIGGNSTRESFDVPLAGWYFHGTPAFDGNELFVVASKNDEIRLWALERRTGNVQWSQLIGYSDTKIDQDLNRRWNASQVAVGNGVIVCPTTIGWLVAVDRLRQRVIWAHRYLPRTTIDRSERDTESAMLQSRELNAQWSNSAPVISGNFVVFTPQEEPLLVCLDLAEGRRIWERPKEQGLYLAGVFEGKVVVANENGLTAYQLADGTAAWTEKFEDGTRITGVGIAADGRYYIPLSNGELRAIALETGQVASQSYVGSREPALGNLVMHRGKLVSLGSNGMSVFGQRDAVAEEIRSRLEKDSEDAWALLRSGEIQLLNRNYVEAATLLRRSASEPLSPSEKLRRHRALVECLSKLIRADIHHRAQELDELGRLATSADDRMLYRELSAEKHLAENDSVKAFEIFRQLAEEAGDSFVVRSDNRNVSVRRTDWLSGRIFEIWFATAHPDRELIDQRIRTVIAQATDQGADACAKVARLFAFHSSALLARERQAEHLIAAGEVTGARLVLHGLSESDDRSVAARATEKLAKLMVSAELFDDAVYFYQMLEKHFSDVQVRDDLTGAEIVQQVQSHASQLDFESNAASLRWKDGPMRLEHSVLNPSPQSQEVVVDTPLPYFSRRSLEAWQNDQRLTLESILTGQVDGVIPLRSALRAGDDGYMSVSFIGHQMYFVNRGILHAASPIERRVLWTQPIDDWIESGGFSRHDGRAGPTVMTAAGHDSAEQSVLLQQSNSAGQLAVVQPNYLCLHGRRSMTVIDPRTGDELWTLDGLPTNAQITGNRDALFVYDAGINDAKAYRASDGKTIEIASLARILNNALVAYGPSLLLFEQRGSDRRTVLARRSRNRTCVLRLHDPLIDVTKWSLDLPAGTVVSPLGQADVVAVQPDGLVKRIEINSGRTTVLEIPGSTPLPKKNNPIPTENYLLADDERIYLIVNSSDTEFHTFGESLTSIRANGIIYTWNRNNNRFLWRQSIKSQNLIVDRFSKSPVLLFISRSWRQRRRVDASIGSLNIQAIHKDTGRVLIETRFPSAYNAFQSVDINPEDRSIDLNSYSVRMRLVSADEAVDPKPAKKSEP